jgi:hypothetical protein
MCRQPDFKNGNLKLHLLDPKPTLINGGTFDEVDIHATLNDAQNQKVIGANGMQAFEGFLVQYINNYPNMPGAAKRHTVAIMAVQSVIELLSFPVGAIC